MPIYEYKCSQCGNTYEKRQKFSDAVDTECNCEKKAPVHRLTSAPALVFKGSGWYINDYARAGSKGEKNGSSEKVTNGAAAKTESKSESSSTSSSDSGSSADSSAAKTTNTTKS